MELFKLCPKCGQEKPFTDFYKASHTKDGRGGYCKSCGALVAKKRYRSNEGARNYNLSYAKKHREHLREIAKENARNSPWIRITKTLRTSLKKHTKFKSNQKTKLVKAHFESLFPSTGVSWDNYGIVWQTKRIKPICEFDLSSAEEVVKINELSNLTIRIIPESERVPRKKSTI